MPAPEAPSAAADSAALEAQDPEEPAVPVRALLVPVRQPVLADPLPRLAARVLAHLAVLVQRPVPADLLLSRQSFSAAMARTTP